MVGWRIVNSITRNFIRGRRRCFYSYKSFSFSERFSSPRSKVGHDTMCLHGTGKVSLVSY